MTVEAFNELLEDELSQAVEVKDPKSLHRAVVLLGNYVSRPEHDDSRRESQMQFDKMLAQMDALRQEFREESRVWQVNFEKNLAVMKERFDAVDRRFEAVDKRFDDARQASDRRFDDANKRFDDVNKRFDDVNKRFDDVNRRFEDANKRFDDASRRFSGFQWLLGIGFTVLAALMSLYQIL